MIDTERLCHDFDLLAQAQCDTELKQSGGYWIGACPFCGGKDRFTVKTKGGVTKWFCRGCGHDRYHDALDYIMRRQDVDFFEACRMVASGSLDSYETDPAKLAEVERFRQERAAHERQEREKRLKDFTTRELGEEYHARLAKKNYDWWQQQGITPDWVDWWRLGYLPEKSFKHGEQLYTCPAYTIPKFDLDWQPVNIDYRLINPPAGVGKYRPEYGLPAAPFLSRPDLKEFPDELIITEGSKKAMVTSLYTYPGQNSFVVGVPSKSSWCGIADRIKHIGRAWIVLDPDAQPEAHKLAVAIGKVARVIALPFKIDDGFLRYGFTWKNLQTAMRWSR